MNEGSLKRTAPNLATGTKGGAAAQFSRQVRLLQLASQALPTGAYAYSSGLEALLESQLLHGEEECANYLSTLMESVVTHLELPLFLRMFDAAQTADHGSLHRASQFLLASRESREFQEQEQQMARALWRVLLELHPEACATHHAPQTFSESLALAAQFYGLLRDEAAVLLVYSWVEPQVSALSRLIPLGPIGGQRLLNAVLQRVPSVIEGAVQVKDAEIGASAPRLALASCLHETQYTRIFRS
jgi:urease accessory protein